MSAGAVIAIVDDERFDAHRERSGSHPESPERLLAARSGLYGTVPANARLALPAREASEAELSAVHDASYVHVLSRALGGYGHLDADTYVSPGTKQAAWLAAGGAAELAATLMHGEVTRGMALLRPPGHHAERDHAMGFCLLNNVAVAAASALAHGAERVAIVDWDVHHGNGTQNAFYSDPRVLFVSVHQYPFYPGTGAPSEIGEGPGLGYTANLALPAQQGSETYGYAFRRVVLPVLEQFRADLVLVSAGFDAHVRDPLGGMALPTDAYRAMASALLGHVEALGHGRLGCVLEGGYDLPALEQSVAAVAGAMLGKRLPLDEGAPSPAGKEAVERTARALAPHWRL